MIEASRVECRNWQKGQAQDLLQRSYIIGLPSFFLHGIRLFWEGAGDFCSQIVANFGGILKVPEKPASARAGSANNNKDMVNLTISSQYAARLVLLMLTARAIVTALLQPARTAWPPHPARYARHPLPPGEGCYLFCFQPSPLGRGWTAPGVLTSRRGPGEGSVP